MNYPNTKAKLIWAATGSGLKNIGAKSIAETILNHSIDAVRMTYSEHNIPFIKNLREALNFENSPFKNQPSAGKIPFLFDFIGRKASCIVPNSQQEVQDGQTILIQISEDYKFFTQPSNALENSTQIQIKVTHEDQLNQLQTNSKLVFSYGAVEAVITKINENTVLNCKELTCQILLGGLLYSGMDVSSPHIPTQLFPLLPEDKKTLSDDYFNSIADYVLVSGLRTKDEFFEIKKMITKNNLEFSKRHPSNPISKTILERESLISPRFLLKIDSKDSLALVTDLLPYMDGIFMSRSKLGQSENPYNLPILQKQLIQDCNKMSKTVIVASELMNSMCKNPNPTRAEVSDLANAAADGVDGLAFSHNVTEGPYPNLVAQISKNTLIQSESWLEEKWHEFEMDNIPSDDDAVTYGAIRIAQQAKVKAIVCFTEGGYTAMKLSSMRTPTKIIAITFNIKIMRQLNLLRSVTCVLVDEKLPMEKILHEAKLILLQNFNFQNKDKFVFVSLTASSVSARNSNLFTLQEIDL